MAKLVTEVIIDKTAFADGSEAEDIVYCVGDFVRALLQRYFTEDEIPDEAVQSHYLDYYECQVNNGNIGQFVTNSRWAPNIVAAIRNALHAIGERKHAKLFDQVDQFVQATLPEMNASVRDGTTGDYWTKVNAVGGGDFYDIFSDSMDDSKTHARLCDANAAWIKTWTNVSLVSETQLESEYDELAKSIPDLDIRRRRQWKLCHGNISG